MTYTVEVSARARRQIAKLSPSMRERVRTAIDALAEDPRPGGVRRLTGHAGRYRVRLGSYRIVYEIRDQVLLVLVLSVAHRKHAYDAE